MILTIAEGMTTERKYLIEHLKEVESKILEWSKENGQKECSDITFKIEGKAEVKTVSKCLPALFG